MSVLVTGGAGYIGSHTVRALRNAGSDVVVLDTMEYGHPEAVIDAPVEVGDIADSPLVRRVIERYRVDQVVHFAGYKAAGESMTMPERYFDNNVARPACCWTRCANAGVMRFVFSSSAAVYGTPATAPGRRGTRHGSGEPVRREQAHGRADAALVQRVSRHSFGRAALLQRRRRLERRPPRRGLAHAAQPGAGRDARGARPDPRPGCVRHRLPDARRQRDPRLHPRGGSGRRPSARARLLGGWRRLDDHQRRHGRRIIGAGSGRGDEGRERRRLPRSPRAPPAGRPHHRVRRQPSRAVRCSSGQPKYGLDDIVRSAWHWHSTHPRGYAT